MRSQRQKARERQQRDVQQQAWDVMDAFMALSPEAMARAKRDDDGEQGLKEIVLDIMRGVPWDVFGYIDEHCDHGVPFAQRFWMLRRVRNRFGKELFAVLKG